MMTPGKPLRIRRGGGRVVRGGDACVALDEGGYDVFWIESPGCVEWGRLVLCVALVPLIAGQAFMTKR